MSFISRTWWKGFLTGVLLIFFAIKTLMAFYSHYHLCCCAHSHRRWCFHLHFYFYRQILRILRLLNKMLSSSTSMCLRECMLQIFTYATAHILSLFIISSRYLLKYILLFSRQNFVILILHITILNTEIMNEWLRECKQLIYRNKTLS